MADRIIIYSDGSSLGNPGPGGYGVVMLFGKFIKELSQGYRRTTNNRMELLAVIVALEALKKRDIPVDIYTDSRYVQQAVSQRWVFSWEKKGFKGKKNPDLWQRFLRIYRQVEEVNFYWVKGHAGHPLNERCDELAVAAAESGHYLVDEGFERG